MQNQVNSSPKLNNDPAIKVDNLKIIFDEKTEFATLVLDNFSHQFAKNKIHFIVGNSGSGKTTLVTHFNGLLKSRYGNIKVGNITILAKAKKIKKFKELRKMVGMVFQFPEYQLFKDTVEKDIIFGPVNLGEQKDKAKLKAKKYLKMMGLSEEFLSHSPFELSGGQKRRVAIAGILAIEPDILIFDEPTAGLDPSGEQEMMQIIKNLKKQGKTVIVITHVMDQVLALGDEVIVLDNKKMIASGAPYDIFTNKEILNSTTLDLPKVIRTINKLSENNKKFERLYEFKPKNVEELALSIDNVIKGGV